MKKLNKALALGMAGAMALSMAACGGNSTSGTASTAGTTSGAADGEVVNLTWVTVGNGQPTNYDAWLEQINPYLEEKIGVNLDVQVVSWGDWDNRRNVIVNTGGEYDILFTNMNTYVNDVHIGAFADISELVKTSSPELYASIPEDYWEACEIDGKLYGVPTYKDSSISEYLVWDKELAEGTGFTIPEAMPMSDLGTLTDTLTAMKDTKGEASFPMNKNGATWVAFEYDNMGTGLLPIGVRYNDETATVVPVLEQPDIQASLNTFHEWYKAGIINSDAATKPEENAYKPCSVAQGWSGAAITSWGPQMGVDAQATKLGPTVISNDTVRGSINCISANCAHPDKALELLQLVNTDSYVRDLLYYGVKGDNWDYTDDTKQWVHKNNADWTMAGYTQGSFFAVTPSDEFDFNQYDEVKELNESAEASVLLGFTLDTSAFKDQLANCVAIYERYKGEMLSGTRPTDEIVPEIMDEMRKAGFDEIVAQCQEQVDAFMATKGTTTAESAPAESTSAAESTAAESTSAQSTSASSAA